MSRRAKGEGGLRLRPDGRYEARLQIVDQFGKRRPLSFYGRTKQEALQKRAAHQAQIALGAPQNANKVKLETYLKAWLDPQKGGVRDHVRPHVITFYESDARLYIIPILGHNYLTALTTSHIQAMADRLLKEGLAPTSVRRVKSVLQSALGDAKRNGLIGYNPADGVRIVDRRQLERKYWNAAQVRRFLAALAAERHPLEAYFVLSLTTGLRVGEALGLRWQDIDLDAGTMRIEQQLIQRRVNGVALFGPVKRRASKREVRLPALAVASLRAHRARQADIRVKIGQQWPAPHNLVFLGESGAPVQAAHIGHKFHQLSARFGLPLIRIHDMRHTAASLMILSGENIKAVSETLGHANINITLDLYGHLYDEQKKHVAEGIDRLLGTKS